MRGVGRQGWCAVDCADPVRLAAFWSEVLGMEMSDPEGNEFCLIFGTA